MYCLYHFVVETILNLPLLKSKHRMVMQPTCKGRTAHTNTHSPEAQTRTSSQRERRLPCTAQFAGSTTAPSSFILKAYQSDGCRLRAELKPTSATPYATIATTPKILGAHNRGLNCVPVGKHWRPPSAITNLDRRGKLPHDRMCVSVLCRTLGNVNTSTVPKQYSLQGKFRSLRVHSVPPGNHELGPS